MKVDPGFRSFAFSLYDLVRIVDEPYGSQEGGGEREVPSFVKVLCRQNIVGHLSGFIHEQVEAHDKIEVLDGFLA